MAQCLGRKRDWSRCQKHALTGKRFCQQHTNQLRIALISVCSAVVLGAIGSWVSGLLPPIDQSKTQSSQANDNRNEKTWVDVERTLNIPDIVSRISDLPLEDAQRFVESELVGAKIRLTLTDVARQMTAMTMHKMEDDAEPYLSSTFESSRWGGRSSGISVWCHLDEGIEKSLKPEVHDLVWGSPVEGFISSLSLDKEPNNPSKTLVRGITLYGCKFPTIDF